MFCFRVILNCQVRLPECGSSQLLIDPPLLQLFYTRQWQWTISHLFMSLLDDNGRWLHMIHLMKISHHYNVIDHVPVKESNLLLSRFFFAAFDQRVFDTSRDIMRHPRFARRIFLIHFPDTITGVLVGVLRQTWRMT